MVAISNLDNFYQHGHQATSLVKKLEKKFADLVQSHRKHGKGNSYIQKLTLDLSLQAQNSILLIDLIGTIYDLSGVIKTLERFPRKVNYKSDDHKDYSASRVKLNGLKSDLIYLEGYRARLKARRFPLRKLYLSHIGMLIDFYNDIIKDIESPLSKLDKPLLTGFSSDLHKESKQWSTRVPAYEFIM